MLGFAKCLVMKNRSARFTQVATTKVKKLRSVVIPESFIEEERQTEICKSVMPRFRLQDTSIRTQGSRGPYLEA